MQLITVKDDKTKLLYTADLFPLATHLNPPYIMGYDLFPLTTLDEKKKYLPMLAKENWILFFEHDPHTETCRVEMTEKGVKSTDKMELKNR